MAGYTGQAADQQIFYSGDQAAIESRIAQIYANRGQPAPSAAQLAATAQNVISQGPDYFQQIRTSIDSAVQSGAIPGNAAGAPAAAASTDTQKQQQQALAQQDAQNAYQMVQGALAQFGITDLGPSILNYAQQGYDQQTIMYLIQQTPEWQQRFAGNQVRLKSGLAALDPATYLDLESQFQQVLNNYGIPQGMYGNSDFANWIGKDVSPSEIQSRVQMASQNVTNSDPAFSQALSAMGVDTGHQIAYFLDQNRALPYLQRQEQASQIGAAALRNHLNLDPQTALTLASIGVTQDQAESGYSQVAKMLPTLSKLSQITPGQTPFTQQTAEQDVLFQNADAARQAQSLTNTEQARFGGSGGVGSSIYHPDYGLSQPLQGAY